MFDRPSNWKTSTLEELSSSITSGGTPTSGDKRYYLEAGGHPFAKTEDLSRSNSKYLSECDLNVSDLALKSSAAKLYPKGTVLVSMYGTIGLPKITDVELAANQALCALIPPFKCNADFLYHMLCFIRPDWLKDSGQTTQANISGGAVKRRVIYVPSAGEQETIANILDTLDTQIRQTEAIIAKLQQVKQGLLHDLLTRGIDANSQLRPPRDQVPELYKESPLGWIPREWEVSNVEAEFNVDSGITLGAHRKPKDHAWPYLRVANVHREKLTLTDISRLEASTSEARKKALKVGDLLVVEGHASKDEIGRCAIANESVEGMLFQNHLFRLRTIRLNPIFALHWMNSQFVQSYWRCEAATSSGLNTINRTKLNRLDVIVPTAEEQERLIGTAKAIDSRIAEELAKASKLKIQKSGLMDDLLTGRVRVTSLLDTAKAS